MTPVLLPVAAVFGLVIGSFLNVVIARVPAGESVVRPGSRCPRCGTPIAARDNLPVLSWLLLRGRGRCCGAPISIRYPIVELLTGLAFTGVAAWAGFGWRLPAFAYLAALSLALAVIDIDTFRLPFWLVAPSYPVAAVLLGAASLAEHDRQSPIRALIGGAALWTFYRLMHLVYPKGMGYGDVRLSGVLGMYLAWLGWDRLVVGAFLGFLVGGLGSAVMLALRRTSLKSQIPYGPYMLAGAWLGVFLGHPVASWYLRTAGLAG
ncbi:MAG TPA: prepilin peptidase [Kineosporiaceae bacterium]|nr:prepilin peptidase [Kineosporiaceae bacterium]